MTALQAALVARARERSDAVLPCGRHRTLTDCFMRLPSGETTLWWNDRDGNTHMESSSALEAVR